MTDTQSSTQPQSKESAAPASDVNPAAAPQFGMGDQLAYQHYAKKHSKVLWGIFALLLLLAGSVFFVLPNYVSAPVPVNRTVAVEAESIINTVSAISPFEEAQRLRQREAAQNTLAALLNLQETLEAKQVTLWAGDNFAAAIDFARQGDLAYREQKFTDANTYYQQGVDLLQAITDNTMQSYLDQVAQGNQALQSGNSALATASFSLALIINPNGEEAVSGLDRAGVLDKVLDLLDEGSKLQAKQELEAAKAQYQLARELDAENPQAQTALQQIVRDIEQRDYSAAMSRGYAALRNNDAEAAETAFKQAQNMRPQSEEVSTGLQQAADQRSTLLVNRHMEAANSAEATENWTSALEQWQQALSIDPNLVIADQGKRRSENRRDLDVFFTTAIREPLRLVDESIYQQTQQLMIDIQQITDPGPRLREQIQKVQQLLEQARKPITVKLESDGITDVTLYRVNPLGKFVSHTLELLPGEYVAVGVREGYRDVRREFIVPIGAAAPLVSVICNEAI